MTFCTCSPNRLTERIPGMRVTIIHCKDCSGAYYIVSAHQPTPVEFTLRLSRESFHLLHEAVDYYITAWDGTACTTEIEMKLAKRLRSDFCNLLFTDDSGGTREET